MLMNIVRLWWTLESAIKVLPNLKTDLIPGGDTRYIGTSKAPMAITTTPCVQKGLISQPDAMIWQRNVDAQAMPSLRAGAARLLAP